MSKAVVPAPMPVIALDAMGGDHGPAVMIAGAEMARVRHPEIRFRLFGDAQRVEAELKQWPKLASVSEVVHTDSQVHGEDKPSQAVRRGRGSSMGLAIMDVREGRAQAAVSSGNTGALMALAKVMLGVRADIARPALAALMPTLRGEVVMLDLGANAECDANNLVDFAVMGSLFACTALGVARPRVALLNIGVEELKGTGSLREAAALLKAAAADSPFDFIGFIEGDKIPDGVADVVVSDGFSGNIALKMAEGTAKLIIGLLKTSFQQSWASRLGYMLARGGLRSLKTHLDPNTHNGAVFLGLNGLVVKSHGGATARGVASAITVAFEALTDDLHQRIGEELMHVKGAAPHVDPQPSVSMI